MGLPGSFLDSTLFLPTSPLFSSSSPEFFLADSLRSGVSFNILFIFRQYLSCEFTPPHACCWVCLIWDWIARIPPLFFVSFFFLLLLPRERERKERRGLFQGPGSFSWVVEEGGERSAETKGEGEISWLWPVGSSQRGAHRTRFFALRS